MNSDQHLVFSRGEYNSLLKSYKRNEDFSRTNSIFIFGKHLIALVAQKYGLGKYHHRGKVRAYD